MTINIFEEWWQNIGSGITPELSHDMEAHSKRVAEKCYMDLCGNIELHRQALAQAKADNRSPEEIQFLQDGLDSHLQQEQKNDE